MEAQKTIKREFTGIVASDKMQKTIVVLVEQIHRHKLYKKLVKKSKKYKVHDEKQIAKVGDKVRFSECRPLSAGKRHRLIEIIS